MNCMHWRSTLVLLVAAAAIAGASRASGATSALAVSIDSGPSGTVTSTDATFAFSAQGGAGAVTFECTLDRVASACTSPKSYSRLAVGTHVFGVVATDARRGRASTRRSWIVAPPAEPPPPPPGGPPPPPAPPPSEPSSPATNTGSAKRVKPKALCPRKRSLGPPIVHGCSALQVVTGTELAGPFVEALGKATEGLGAIARVG
jgi:hypothetical protein